MRNSVLLSLLLLLLLQHSSYAEPNPPVRLGAISVLSGEGASWGVNHQRGTLLAVEEANAAGGIKGRSIEVTFEDSPSGLAKGAVLAYSHLVYQKGIRVILGPLMGDELLALSPRLARDGVFLVGATYMRPDPHHLFSVWSDADIESDTLARTVFTTYKSVAILSSQQSWEAQVAARFAKTYSDLGGTVVSYQEPSFEASDVKAEALKARSANPEAIFISSYLLLPKYSKELKQYRDHVPLFGIELDRSITRLCGDSIEGLRFIGPARPSTEFTEKFTTRWKAAPEIPAAQAYDGATLLFRALVERGENTAAVADYFANFTSYRGASGNLQRKNGRMLGDLQMFSVSGDEIRSIGAISP